MAHSNWKCPTQSGQSGTFVPLTSSLEKSLNDRNPRWAMFWREICRKYCTGNTFQLLCQIAAMFDLQEPAEKVLLTGFGFWPREQGAYPQSSITQLYGLSKGLLISRSEILHLPPIVMYSCCNMDLFIRILSKCTRLSSSTDRMPQSPDLAY